MKPMCTILGFAALAALVANGGEKAIKNGDTLVFMGDSITDYGASRSHGYPNLVVKGLAANGIAVAWYGAGIAGNTSTDMLNRFDADVIAKHPDVVTISAGVNDCWFNKWNDLPLPHLAQPCRVFGKQHLRRRSVFREGRD